MKRRIVITGLGAMSALGEGAANLWQAAVEGRSGIERLDFNGAHHASSNGNGAVAVETWNPIGGRVPSFNPEKFIDQRKAIKVMARDIQLAVAASKLALEDARMKPGTVSAERIGVIVGSGVLNHELDELAYSVQASLDPEGGLDLQRFGEEGMSRLFPLWLLKYLPNMSACHVSILFDLHGPNNTLTTGASAGLQALGEAARIIERGAAEVMLAGGAESKLNPVGLSQYQVLGALSDLRDEDPKSVYRPFDASARGLVVGEGAAFLVLEELEHAKKRGARIYAEVAGFGSSYSQGRSTAMSAALADAGVDPKEIGYIQAAGLGIPEEDRREARAIEEVFGKAASGLKVTSLKPVTGFAGFAAGALDALVSAKALAAQTIPPTPNFEEPVMPFPFSVVRRSAERKKFDFTMINSFGFHGQCASAILKRFEGSGS